MIYLVSLESRSEVIEDHLTFELRRQCPYPNTGFEERYIFVSLNIRNYHESFLI